MSCAWPREDQTSFPGRYVHAVSFYGLKFAKPRGNASENVRLFAMRTSQLRAFTRKTCETLSVKLESSINVVPCYRTHELKHGHQGPFIQHSSRPTPRKIKNRLLLKKLAQWAFFTVETVGYACTFDWKGID
jgi:hypothetical protein